MAGRPLGPIWPGGRRIAGFFLGGSLTPSATSVSDGWQLIVCTAHPSTKRVDRPAAHLVSSRPALDLSRWPISAAPAWAPSTGSGKRITVSAGVFRVIPVPRRVHVLPEAAAVLRRQACPQGDPRHQPEHGLDLGGLTDPLFEALPDKSESSTAVRRAAMQGPIVSRDGEYISGERINRGSETWRIRQELTLGSSG